MLISLLLNATSVTPMLRNEEKNMPLSPWMDPENFNPGYLMRSVHLLPQCGDKSEWQHTQDYWLEKEELPAVNLENAPLVYK